MHHRFNIQKIKSLLFFALLLYKMNLVLAVSVFSNKDIIEYQFKKKPIIETVTDREQEITHNKIQDFKYYDSTSNNHKASHTYESSYKNGYNFEQKNTNYSSFLPKQELLVREKKEDNNNEFEIHSIIGNYVDPEILNHQYKSLTSPLSLNQNDIRFEKGIKENYYDLIIRKKPEVNSVLLTNYFWSDSKGQAREYGLRSLQFNEVNGNEKRLFKKIFIGRKQGLYFLVDSSPSQDKYFGQAFRIRIPKYVVYGYRKKNEIYGVLRIKDGIKFNIRSFNRKFADYKGQYQDNPVVLMLNGRPLDIKDRPIITKVKEVLGEKYIGAYVEYESKNDFFKSFLVREEKEKTFKEVFFNNDTKEDKHAVLLEAYYKNGRGKILKAVIYFKRTHSPKTFYITAVDKNKIQAVGDIQIEVPAYYYDSNDQSEFPYENHWHNEDILTKIN